MAQEPTILFVKPGAIKPTDKGRLSKAGVIVVETEDPNGCVLTLPSQMRPVVELSHGELLLAFATAAKGANSSFTYGQIGAAVVDAIIARASREEAPDCSGTQHPC